ncbi:hypothetical protein AB4305_02935 [Nocardia sp. 2YAB30]|uniref:hypothetical protein n=1 Tax=unclassified Nocardia TaxID=2637762 RepID=UPI003F982E65
MCRCHPELADDADGITHRGRLHQPRQYQLEERLIGDHTETEIPPAGGDGLDQPPGTFAGDPRRPGRGAIQTEIQHLLPGQQSAAGGLQ